MRAMYLYSRTSVYHNIISYGSKGISFGHRNQYEVKPPQTQYVTCKSDSLSDKTILWSFNLMCGKCSPRLQKSNLKCSVNNQRSLQLSYMCVGFK